MSSTDALQFDVEQFDAPLRTLLAGYAREHRLLLVLGIASAIVSPVASLVPIYLIETVVDGILLGRVTVSVPFVPTPVMPDKPVAQLVVVTSVMLAFALFGAVTAWVGAWAWGRVAQEAQHGIRVDTFHDLQQREYAFFEQEATGQLVSIVGDDVDQLNRLLERHLAQGIELSARFAGILILLFVLHWQLALVLFLAIPILAITARVFVRRLRPKHHAVRQHVGALTAHIQNTLLYVGAIKAYGRQAHEIDRVTDASRQLYDRRWDVVRTRAKFFPAMSSINWLSFSVLLVLGGYWILVGPPGGIGQPLHVGTLVTFMLFSQQVTDPLVQAAGLVDEYYEGRASAVRILSVRRGRTDRPPVPVRRENESAHGHIQIEDLTFRYDEGEDVLRGISVDVTAGTHVGIVGSTGSGKTTFVKLLIGFYEPDRGRVCIDGRDIATIDRSVLRAQFGVVMQDPMVFAGSIGENIAYAKEGATLDEIERASKRADLHSFVTSLPDGYETRVGERGVSLSGGQRQRIALARAFLADPPVLVLDEATSQVDVETESIIRRSIEDTGATTISIAHRLTSVRHAEHILVFDDGAIAESGSHEELLEADGVYARLWKTQTGQLRPTLA